MLSNVSSSPVEVSRLPLPSPETRDRFGRLLGRVMPPGRPPAAAARPTPSAGVETAAARADRSARIRRQMSRRALAMCLARPSHRNTWHMCLRVTQSRATYAKSLQHSTTGLHAHYRNDINYNKTNSSNNNKNKNKIKYGEKRFSICWMEFLHPAMRHDHDIDFAR